MIDPSSSVLWNFRKDGVTCKVHLIMRVEVRAGFVDEFKPINLLQIGVGYLCLEKSINGSVDWIGVPDFLRNDGILWTLNLLAPFANWEEK